MHTTLRTYDRGGFFFKDLERIDSEQHNHMIGECLIWKPSYPKLHILRLKPQRHIASNLGIRPQQRTLAFVRA